MLTSDDTPMNASILTAYAGVDAETRARVRSDAFYAAAARQIARDFAGLDPGPGFDISPPLAPSPLPLLCADEIDWSSTPVEAIPYEGGALRASTIAYRELALAGCHALHAAHRETNRLTDHYHRALDALRALRATVSPAETLPSAPPTQQARFPLSGLAGLQGVRGVQGVR